MPTTSPPSPVPSQTESRGRVDVFDGLRGIAIILVVLSHGWAIWPSDYTLSHRPLSTLFASGNFAVSIFFVVGAFVATRGLLRKAHSPAGLHPVVEIVRRYLRLTGQVAFLLLVVLMVSVFDETDPATDQDTRVSMLRIVTYSWNWYLQSNAIVARSDLGHLWYLSVYLQVLSLITVLVWMLRRRPMTLVVVLATMLVCFELWTAHVYPQEGYYQALLRTSVRIDAPLTGALAAAALPHLSRFRPHAPLAGTLAALSLIPLAYFTTPNAGYFGWAGYLTDAALFVFVVSAVLAPLPRPVAAPLAWAPLAFLGRRSLGLYIWHYPVFFFIPRHTLDWAWGWRTAAALALVLACTLLSEWLVENRVQRALESPAWRELDYGIPAYVARRWRSRRGSERVSDADAAGPPSPAASAPSRRRPRADA